MLLWKSGEEFHKRLGTGQQCPRKVEPNYIAVKKAMKVGGGAKKKSYKELMHALTR